MSERTSVSNENGLDDIEMIMASRILLELICDVKNSFQFMELPFKYSVSVYSLYSTYYKNFDQISIRIINYYLNVFFRTPIIIKRLILQYH